jgi:hypothetical protein
MQLTLEIFRGQKADDPFAFRTGTQEYVLRSPLGGAETATLDWDATFLSELAALRRPGRDPILIQRMGERLRRFLATTHFARAEGDLLAAVERRAPITLTLRLSAAELYALPWELLTLKQTGQYLGALPGILLRYAWPDTRTTPPSPRPEGGRLLFAWSAAGGAVPAAEHQQAIARACALGHHPFDPALDVLPRVSYARLYDALVKAREREPIAVLHILCHGVAVGGSWGLAWDDEHGAGERAMIDAAQLRELLAAHAGLVRLVVLAACDSGNSGQIGNHLGSLALALHRAGIAAVIAARYPLSVSGSIKLSEALYEALIGGPTSVESAFRAARVRKMARIRGRSCFAPIGVWSRFYSITTASFLAVRKSDSRPATRWPRCASQGGPASWWSPGPRGPASRRSCWAAWFRTLSGTARPRALTRGRRRRGMRSPSCAGRWAATPSGRRSAPC